MADVTRTQLIDIIVGSLNDVADGLDGLPSFEKHEPTRKADVEFIRYVARQVKENG